MDFKYEVPKKGKIKVYKIPVPMYRCSVYFATSKESLKLEKKWANNEDCGAQTRDYLKQNNDILISFYEEKIRLADAVHELTHATQMIMYSRGHNHCKEKSDEPFAYLLTYLFEEFQKIIKKKKINVI